jgi:glucose/arabinose dehydrogenase
MYSDTIPLVEGVDYVVKRPENGGFWTWPISELGRKAFDEWCEHVRNFKLIPDDDLEDG